MAACNAGGEGGAGVHQPDSRRACCFHHNVDAGGQESLGVVGDECPSAVARVVKAARGILLGWPMHSVQRRFRALHIQVGDAEHMDSRRADRLRQIHRAKFAGADDADANRIVCSRAGSQHAGKVHIQKDSLLGLVTFCGELWRRPSAVANFSPPWLRLDRRFRRLVSSSPISWDRRTKHGRRSLAGLRR